MSALNDFYPVHNNLGKQIWVSLCTEEELQISDPTGVIYDSSSGSGSGAQIGNWGSDNQTADSWTTVTAGDPTTTVELLISSPPAWLSSAGVFSGDGIYAVWAELDVVTPGSAVGQYAFVGCPFNLGFPISLDALHASDAAGLGGFNTPMDIQAFTNADGDLPRTAFVRVTVPSAATGWAIKVRPWVDRLAYT